MKDPFSYSARWDSVGIDCAFCKHQSIVEWPNTEKKYKCKLHGISLATTLDLNGYKEGEWFCSKFENNGRAHKAGIKELDSIRKLLDPNTLYGAFGNEGRLKQIPFTNL